MERRSWPWRKKTTPKVLESHSNLTSPAVSFKAYDEPPPNVNVEQETARIQIEEARVLEAISLREQAEEKTKSLTEKLSSVTNDMSAKEEMVKRHAKVAEDAVSGWEKAEAEALLAKQDLEASIQERNALEGRIAHLDGALKECMRQVRHARDEQEQKIQEAILWKTRECDQVKAELCAKQAELEQRLMESNAENSAMTKSLQERARAIVEANEAKARAETEMKVLQVRLESLEKEISALKYELHVLNKELEIRNEEREYSKKSADAAHKQHLENVKKIAKMEAECQRLRTLVRKKLPGPAALAQMRMEVEGMGRNIAGDSRRRRSFSRSSPSPASVDSHSQQELRDAVKEIEMLRERMLSMEEETQLLKEALAKRNGELQAARQLCARTATKLSVAEDQLESLHGTPRASKNGVESESLQGTPRGSTNGVDLQTETSIASRSEDGNGGMDEEVSCAESWASALISELASFKKNKAKAQASTQSMESSNFDGVEEILQAGASSTAIKPSTEQGSNSTENHHPETVTKVPEDRKSLKTLARKEAELQSASGVCKDVSCKLSLVKEQLQAQGDNGATTGQVQEILRGLVEAHEQVSKLDRVLDDMRIAIVTPMDDVDGANAADATSKGDTNDTAVDGHLVADHPGPISCSTVSCKIVSLLEMMLQPLRHPIVEADETKIADANPRQCDEMSLKVMCSRKSVEQQMQGLVTVKEQLLHGKAGVLEFLLRLALVLSGLCNSECSELGSFLTKDIAALSSTVDENMKQAQDAGDSGKGEDLFASDVPIKMEMENIKQANVELANELTAAKEELLRLNSELVESKRQMAEHTTQLQNAEKKLELEEAAMQGRLQKAETEASKLQGCVASLTIELGDQRKQYEDVVAKCGELENKLQAGFQEQQHARSDSRRLADDEEARSRKEREVASAKEKLAECQRTILVLGKQLTALSSPPAHSHSHSHSRAASLDSLSMDSATMDHRVAMVALQQQQQGAELERLPSMEDQQHPGHERYYAHAHRRQMEQQQQQHHRRRRPPFPGGGHGWRPYDQTPPEFYLPLHPSAQHQFGRHLLPDDPFLRSSALDPNGVHSLLPSDYPSPPQTSMSSPAGSPGRYVQLGSRRNSGNAVRVSLAKSMNHAAAVASSSNALKPPKNSSFTRFFSRPKNHC